MHGGSSRLLIDYPEPYRRQVLDYLFKPGVGASFQHLKVEIGAGINSTDGTEPTHMRSRDDLNFTRGYEWWLMKEAKKRNPEIILDCLAWGAPAWIQNFFSEEMADYIANFLVGAKQVHDLDIGYTGIWNERGYDAEWIKLLRRKLDQRGLAHVKIVAADEFYAWTFVDALIADPELASVVDVIGSHYWNEVPEKAFTLGKPIWLSEAGPWRGDWRGAREMAQLLNRNYIKARITKTLIWSLVSSYHDILSLPNSGPMRAKEPWSGHYQLEPGLWTIAHTTHFAKPGWKYIEGGACRLLNVPGSIVSLKSADGNDYTMVIETFGSLVLQRHNLTFTNLPAKPLYVWQTAHSASLVLLTNLLPENSWLSLTLAPEAIYTVTTVSNPPHSRPTPPPKALFPLPYRDDFSTYQPGETPKYFSDQAGTFEVAASGEAHGNLLKQVVTKSGIQWMPEFEPYSLIGDRFMADYEISARTLLESDGFVSLFARIEKVYAISPAGYYIRLYTNPGRFELWKKDVLISSGPLTFPTGIWHDVRLGVSGNTIYAVVDGEVIYRGADDTYPAGLAGIGCGWHAAAFKDVSIASLHGSHNVTPAAHITAGSIWSEEFRTGYAADENYDTGWGAYWWPEPPWIQFDFAEEQTASRIVFWESENDSRISSWLLQY